MHFIAREDRQTEMHSIQQRIRTQHNREAILCPPTVHSVRLALRSITLLPSASNVLPPTTVTATTTEVGSFQAQASVLPAKTIRLPLLCLPKSKRAFLRDCPKLCSYPVIVSIMVLIQGWLNLQLPLASVDGFVFSRTPITKHGDTREYLTGIFSLRNEEEFTVTGNAKDFDSRFQETNDYGNIKVTITKSPVVFAYDLKYEIDVFSDFSESVFKYPWGEGMRGWDKKDYQAHCYLNRSVQNCDKIWNNTYPDGRRMAKSQGRCCWCQDFKYIAKVEGRGNLSCRPFGTLFHSAPSFTKFCPKVTGPWYAAFSIGPWRWMYTLDVLIEWYAPGSEDTADDDPMFSSSARTAEYQCLKEALRSRLVTPAKNLTANPTANLTDHRSTVDDDRPLDILMNETLAEPAVKLLPTDSGMVQDPSTGSSSQSANGIITATDVLPLSARRLLNVDSVFAHRTVQECRKKRSRAAGLKSARFELNFTTPQLWDDQFKLEVKITGSQPQMDAFPPTLNDRYLFIPIFPDTDPIVQRSKLSHGCGYNTKPGSPHRVLSVPIEDPSLSPPDPIENHVPSNWLSRLMDSLEGDGDRSDEPTQLFEEHGTLKRSDQEEQDKKRTDPSLRANCLSEALLLPSSYVDLTGAKCNVVGSSLLTWMEGNGLQFCQTPPGHCMANQIGKLRNRDEERIRKGETPLFRVGSHSLPGFTGALPHVLVEGNGRDGGVDTTAKDKLYKFAWTYPYEHMTSVEIQLAAENIVWMQTFSPGEIDEVRSDLGCVPLSVTPCVVDVVVKNIGTVSSRFVVSIPYCVDARTGNQVHGLEPLSPVGHVVKAQRSSLFRFSLKSTEDGVNYYTCKVGLSDAEGRRLDQSLFNVSFIALQHQFNEQTIPLWPPEVEVFIIDANGTSFGLFSFLSPLMKPFNFLGGVVSSVVGGGGNGEDASGSAECNCSFWRVFCLVFHFRSCLRWVKSILWYVAGGAGIIASLYFCGPTLRLCVRITGRRMTSVRKRQQQYVASIEKKYKKNKLCGVNEVEALQG